MDTISIVILGILILAVIILAIKEEKNTDKSEKNEILEKESEFNSLKEKLKRNREVYGTITKKPVLPTGEWEKKVRENLMVIEDISQKYNVNKPLKVLIGDYARGSVDNTTSILESMGMNVNIAQSGEEIIERVNSGEKYDLIITNNTYKNGEYDGTALLRELKDDCNFKNPIIVLTIAEDREELFKDVYGFDGYMTKLLTQEKVLDTFPKIIKDLKFTKIEEKQ